MESPAARAALVDPPVSPRLKLAAIWTSVLFLMIYADYFELYLPMPGLDDLPFEQRHLTIRMLRLPRIERHHADRRAVARSKGPRYRWTVLPGSLAPPSASRNDA